MSQTAYNEEMGIAQIGQLVDTRNRHVDSYIAMEAIPFGLCVARSNNPAKPNSVRLPRRTMGLATLSGDLVASNVVNGSVNGEAIDPVTFSGDHDATMDLLVAALEALDVVARAKLLDESGNNRAVSIEIYDDDILLENFAVTLGAGQATFSIGSGGNLERLAGVSVFNHTRVNPGSGGAAYADGDAVSVLTQGAIWVSTVDVPDLNPAADEAYTAQKSAPLPVNVIIGGTDKGKFSGTPAPGGATVRALSGAAFRSVIEEVGDIASCELLINMPGASTAFA